ncbi:DNA polymerase III subunit beta [Paenibacillus sp. VTT E-133280]|uniref:DNA polymerase III subunit beta n=1 Tax=Paenibacillus sp. VTT E-133280 TaxID=1986222 RepID=UPI000B9FDE57|nr:DNA polymerase III subunit beta [Paenibacillus sp. VTT E-133280]OZQ66101.1 DNA polymerase III subunit beta [Paenibacillus sp. VTT E-133280]
MKISIDKHVLVKPLEQASKFISSKTLIPILGEILIQATSEGLYLTGGDDTRILRTKISDDDYQLIESGSITVSGKRITEIVKIMKGVIDIESKGLETKISNGKRAYDLPSMNPDEYPAFIEDIEGPSVEFDGKSLNDLVEETAFAASKEEKTPILMGLLVKFSENTVHVISTDRHRFSSSVRSVENMQDMQTIIEAATMKELMKIIAPTEKLKIKLLDSKLIIQTSSFIFCSRVLEGVYPDTSRIVPTTWLSNTKVDRQLFLEALESVWIIADEEKSKIVRMVVGENIELRASVEGVGKTSQSIDFIDFSGEGFNLSFNCKYVLDAVKSITSKELTIAFTGKMSPIIFRGTDDERNFRIVLPYRTTEV